MADADLIVPCPWCQKDFPVLVLVRALTVCPHCLHACAFDQQRVRVATGDDVSRLVTDELAELRRVRKNARQRLKYTETVQ